MIDEETKKKAKKIVASLTNEEKISLLQGRDFWFTNSVDEKGIHSFRTSDGPHGLRTQDGDGDNMGIGASVAAICYPPACSMACTFDPELLRKVGNALAEECIQENVGILLGPGVNHKRSPLCGRNFEYFSEDPYLTGVLATGYINGVQEKGIGTCLKHFCANSQEKERLIANSVVDERTLHEIYLKQFEYIIKNAKPASIMPSYNRVNGVYSCENKEILVDFARKRWGFDGAFISDWGAVAHTVNSYVNGLDLEMPGTIKGKDKMCLGALKSGILPQERVDEIAEHITGISLMYDKVRNPNYKYNVDAHLKLAQEVAENSAVLLKNDDKLLPLDKSKRYAIIGGFCKYPRYQGAGSSLVYCITTDNSYEALVAEGLEFDYTDGYMINGKTDKKLLKAACEAAKDKDAVIIMAGLPDNYESEGFDRNSLSMPEGHNKLIEEVSKVNPNVVVVLMAGSPVTMPWLNNVKGVLHTYLSGCQGGKALANILLGKVNPSGRLPETYPLGIEDTPCYRYYLKQYKTCEYRESIFTGYRFYDTAGQGVLFPFGYGLSYTEFEYSDLKVSKDLMNEDDHITVSFKVKNIGNVKGKESPQLYISHLNPSIFKADKELRKFTKIELNPGEEKEVEFILDFNDFTYWNVNIHDWDVESGEYKIMIGKSSREIILSTQIAFNNSKMHEVPNYKETAPAYFNVHEIDNISIDEFEAVLGHHIPVELKVKKPYNDNVTFNELAANSAFWRFVAPFIKAAACKGMSKELKTMAMAQAMESPIRGIGMLMPVNTMFMEGLILVVNGKLIKGLHQIKKSMKK